MDDLKFFITTKNNQAKVTDSISITKFFLSIINKKNLNFENLK
jgi:hypothetical protein